jgi:transcriptional regulator GlxA family with amidase domain
MTASCALRRPTKSGRIAYVRKRTAKTIGGRGRHTVAVALSHGFSPFEFGVACEVFGIDRSDLGVPWYRFKVCAVDPPPIRADTGFTVEAPWGLEALRRADTIVVPPPGRIIEPRPELLEVLRRAHARGARIMSECTGAFTLAAAGLLDGRRATTHWMYAEELTRRYPKVKLDPGVLYVDDGDILTSAGTAAGIDLCLHVVRLDFGAEVATQVARRMVVPPHRDGGQAQFIGVPVPDATITGDSFAETLEWAQAHVDEALTVEDLARRSAMSPRTFARRFVERTGTTPRQWLLRQRVLLAQQLLETTDLSVDVVANRCGLGTAANLRLLFQRLVRTSPSAYRRTFREAEAS